MSYLVKYNFSYDFDRISLEYLRLASKTVEIALFNQKNMINYELLLTKIASNQSWLLFSDLIENIVVI